MTSVQSVANLSIVAFSLATDRSKETVSCLIHMAKLQDPTITLVFSLLMYIMLWALGPITLLV